MVHAHVARRHRCVRGPPALPDTEAPFDGTRHAGRRRRVLDDDRDRPRLDPLVDRRRSSCNALQRVGPGRAPSCCPRPATQPYVVSGPAVATTASFNDSARELELAPWFTPTLEVSAGAEDHLGSRDRGAVRRNCNGSWLQAVGSRQ